MVRFTFIKMQNKINYTHICKTYIGIYITIYITYAYKNVYIHIRAQFVIHKHIMFLYMCVYIPTHTIWKALLSQDVAKAYILTFNNSPLNRFLKYSTELIKCHNTTFLIEILC